VTPDAPFRVGLGADGIDASVPENLSSAATLVAEAAGQGANWSSFPSISASWACRDTDKVVAREGDGAGPIQISLRRPQSGTASGSSEDPFPLACPDPGKVRNSCLVYDSKGRRVARYDKIHYSAWSSERNGSTRRGR